MEFTTGTTCGQYAHARFADRKALLVNTTLDAVQAFVERAYIRLQAGDALIRCLDEGSTNPIQQMIEGLVLAGPQSLETLNEILAETGQRKSQLENDLHQVFSGLETGLKQYGVHLSGVHNPRSAARLTLVRFLALLHEQGITDQETEMACLRLLRDSRSLIKNIVTYTRLLDEIEATIRDWMWGLAFESARETKNGSPDRWVI